MTEHTITKMRELLSSKDSEMFADMKATVRHKFRPLQETQKLNRGFGGGAAINRQNIKTAAAAAGVTNKRAIEAITNLLVAHPEAVFNSVFWKKMGSGAASAFLHGKFDTEYKAPEEGGALSRHASSFERVGGKLGTGAYKAGRALQKAEKWFNVTDPDQTREYSRGSAFSHARRGAVDACIKRRINIRGGADSYIGHEMGSPGYEKCMSDPSEQRDMDIFRKTQYAEVLPKVLQQMGYDPATYLKTKRDEMAFKRGKFNKKRGKHLRR